jgi:hypothetical protein
MVTINIDPMAVGSFGGNFTTTTEGYIQGQALQDPASRFELASGRVADAETLPMWGGVAISETIGTTGLGNDLVRALTEAGITGFTVFDQAHNMIQLPNQVPMAFGGNTMSFYRLGSGARIPVACDPALAASLVGGTISPQVTWDYNAQRLVEYKASGASVSVTSVTASYSSTTGLWTFVVAAAAASNVGAVGDVFTVSGVTGTGAASINAQQVATAWTDNQHFSFQIPGISTAFTAGAQAGTIVLVESTGALSVKVLDIQVGNSKIVQYNAYDSTATWNQSGTVAVIQL